MNPFRILLLSALILVVFGVGNAEAEYSDPILEYIGSYDTDFNIRSVTISENHTYVAAGNNGLVIVNIEDPSNPTFVGNYSTDGYVHRVAISGNYAYVAAGGFGLTIVNIEDPANPTFVGSYDIDQPDDVTISGNYAYVADNQNGLIILNIEDPADPTFVGSYDINGNIWSVTISENYAYITNNGLTIVNIEVPSNPTFVGSYNTSDTRGVTISENYAYIGDGSGGLAILDIEDPANPTLVGSYDALAGYAQSVTISGNYAYVAEYDGGVVILNIEDPANPTFVGSYDIEVMDVINPIDISGNYAYVAERFSGNLVILGIRYPPVATIDSIAPSPAEKGTTVFFNGTGLDDSTVVSYLWESSIDGKIGTDEDFSSNNLSLGHHTITFIVQDNDGIWSDVVSELLLVFIYPVALANDIGWNDEDPKNKFKPGDEVIFKGGGNDEDGTIVLYEWDFNGDGEFDWSSEETGSTTFAYIKEGNYNATLRVTDNDGFTDTDSRVITVSEKDEDDGDSSLPSLSLITSLISIGLIAIFRRK